MRALNRVIRRDVTPILLFVGLFASLAFFASAVIAWSYNVYQLHQLTKESETIASRITTTSAGPIGIQIPCQMGGYSILSKTDAPLTIKNCDGTNWLTIDAKNGDVFLFRNGYWMRTLKVRKKWLAS